MIRLAVLSLLFTAALHAQDGVIAGVVRDAVTKTPLPGAEVSIAAGPFRASSTSDGGGAFRFEHLSRDSYRVQCRLTGYEGTNVLGASHLVDLKSQAAREGMLIELTALSTIEGTVFDEEGSPMSGVSVYSLGNLHGSTDGSGRFQMKDLPPGAYRIDLRVPFEVRKRTLKHVDETGETFGYPATVYYPGAADAQSASTVQVSAGLTLRGVDVRLRRVLLVNVSGRVLERTDGKPMTEARVELGPNFITLPGETFAARAVDRAAAFRFELLQPGSYALKVFRGEAKLPFVQTLEIGKAGIEDLQLAVPPVERLEGAVTVEQEGVAWAGSLELSILSKQRAGSSQNWRVSTSRFSLDDLPPGQYALMVRSDAQQKGTLRNLVVSGIRLGAQPLTGNLLTVVEGGNPPLEIRLSSDTGRLVVKILEPDGVPRERLVFWQSARVGDGAVIRSLGRSGASGALTIDDLAPGVYEVGVTAEDATPTPVARTTRVEVKAGETALVEVRPAGR